MSITKTVDPITVEIERLVGLLSIKTTFVHANLFEANLSLDTLTDEDSPVFVYLTPEKTENTVTETNLLIRKVIIVGMFLDIVRVDMDFSTSNVDADVYKMEQLAAEFIKLLNASTSTYKLIPVVAFSLEKIYAKFDSSLFGVGINFEWAFNTQKGLGCL